MSLFFRTAAETRAVSQDAFFESTSGADSLSGLRGESALRLTPVYSAVALLADSVASLPLHAYRTASDGTRQRVAAYSLLDTPTAYGTRYDWLHRLMVSLLLRGNAYGLVLTRNSDDAWPTAVEWLNPADVTVDDTYLPATYYVKGRRVERRDMVHVVAFARPGRAVGLSPIQAFAETIDLGLSAQRSARDWYRNGSRPSQSLRNTQKTIDPAVAKVVKDRYRATVGDGDVFVHGADWELKQLGVTAADAQFLDTIKATATQVAAIYRVPPEKIGGETGSSLTYNTVELATIDFLTHSLRPWLVRVEQALATQMPPGMSAKFNVDAMIRADLKTRYESHEIALSNGFLTQDEVRLIEDRLPLSDDEKSEWLARKSGATHGDPERLARIAQKVYLAVGSVLTPDEAREVMRQAGMELDGPPPSTSEGVPTHGTDA